MCAGRRCLTPPSSLPSHGPDPRLKEQSLPDSPRIGLDCTQKSNSVDSHTYIHRSTGKYAPHVLRYCIPECAQASSLQSFFFEAHPPVWVEGSRCALQGQQRGDLLSFQMQWIELRRFHRISFYGYEPYTLNLNSYYLVIHWTSPPTDDARWAKPTQ